LERATLNLAALFFQGVSFPGNLSGCCFANIICPGPAHILASANAYVGFQRYWIYGKLNLYGSTSVQNVYKVCILKDRNPFETKNNILMPKEWTLSKLCK
jgi:hypothetical protein